MSSAYPQTSTPSGQPSLKRIHTDEDDTQVDELMLGASQMSVSPPPPQQKPPNPKFLHWWKLDNCAKLNNAVETYFSENTSLVYHFVDVYEEDVDDETKELRSCTLRCGICGKGKWGWKKGGKHKGSTSNIKRHLEEHHTDFWASLIRFNKAVLEGKSNAENDETMGVGSSTVSTFNINDFYKKLTRWVVTGNQPFTEIENEEFRDMVIYLRPALNNHLVRATAIKERLLSHADIMRESTKQYLQYLPGLMAIACDGWTSSNRIAFLAIMGSWITSDWKLQETLLDFVKLPGAHTGENMADLVGRTLTDLGIVDRVVSLVSDNASNNDTLVRNLSRQLQRLSPDARWDGTNGITKIAI